LIDAAVIQKEKCQYGGCEHTPEVIGEEIHDEGVCWKITRPELEKVDTNQKFCPCKREAGLIRRFKRTGFIEPEKHDIMIPKKCQLCKKTLLIRLDEEECVGCFDLHNRYI